MSENKNNTYTDHPLYQQSVERPNWLNKLRYLAGVVVIVFIALPLLLTGVIAVPWSLYELLMTLLNMADFYRQQVMLAIVKPFLFVAVAFVGYEFFRWGRHLTRATSREFI